MSRNLNMLISVAVINTKFGRELFDYARLR